MVSIATVKINGSDHLLAVRVVASETPTPHVRVDIPAGVGLRCNADGSANMWLRPAGAQTLGAHLYDAGRR